MPFIEALVLLTRIISVFVSLEIIDDWELEKNRFSFDQSVKIVQNEAIVAVSHLVKKSGGKSEWDGGVSPNLLGCRQGCSFPKQDEILQENMRE